MNWNSESDKLPFPIKAAALLVVGLFFTIGIIGLVLPIIPGIIFLALAALMLSKVSSRFAFFLDQQPLWHKLKKRWRSLGLLPVSQKVKLVGLYCLRGVVDGLRQLSDSLARRFS